MAIISLTDPRVRSFVRSNERLRTAKVIGKGSFCRVFETPDPTRVLKLTTDSAHAAYLVDRFSPQGPFKPIVHHNYDVVCETLNGLDVRLFEPASMTKPRPRVPDTPPRLTTFPHTEVHA